MSVPGSIEWSELRLEEIKQRIDYKIEKSRFATPSTLSWCIDYDDFLPLVLKDEEIEEYHQGFRDAEARLRASNFKDLDGYRKMKSRFQFLYHGIDKVLGV